MKKPLRDCSIVTCQYCQRYEAVLRVFPFRAEVHCSLCEYQMCFFCPVHPSGDQLALRRVDQWPLIAHERIWIGEMPFPPIICVCSHLRAQRPVVRELQEKNTLSQWFRLAESVEDVLQGGVVRLKSTAPKYRSAAAHRAAARDSAAKGHTDAEPSPSPLAPPKPTTESGAVSPPETGPRPPGACDAVAPGALPPAALRQTSQRRRPGSRIDSLALPAAPCSRIQRRPPSPAPALPLQPSLSPDAVPRPSTPPDLVCPGKEARVESTTTTTTTALPNREVTASTGAPPRPVSPRVAIAALGEGH